SQPERDPGDADRGRAQAGPGPALHPGDHRGRQAHPADRRRAGGLLPGADPAGRRVPRQPGRRRPRRGSPAGRARPLDRRPGRPGDAPPRHALRRPGRDRRLPHRGQRHQPDLRARAGRPVRPQHRRAAVRRHRGRAGGMSTAEVPAPRIGERQRLSATLVLSALVHGIVILGLGFAFRGEAPLVPTLDVIFSNTSTELTPEQADFLAQANNRGGGEHDQARRPRDSQPGVVPRPEEGEAPLPQAAQEPPPAPEPQARVVTSRRGEQPVPEPQPLQQAETLPPVSPARAARDTEMARLAAEVYLRSELYAKRPTRKFVSASTREYAYANYLREWVDRAERIGNLNYPDEARRRRLGGQVVIS